MFSSASLITTILLALSVAASPINVRSDASPLPFSTHLNLTSTGTTLADLDRMRAAHLRQLADDIRNALQQDDNTSASTSDVKGKKRAAPGNVNTVNSGVAYTASIGVGNPPTSYTLLLDTGSSNTWVGASKKYNPTSFSQNTNKAVSVGYGSGTMHGIEYTDTVTISPSLVIQKQSIGVATSAQGFQDIDGILGLGPLDLTQGTVAGSSTIPTVADNLLAQKTIPSEVIGISFNPISSSSSGGELTFGGTDTTKYTGSITYAPITNTFPSSYYWGVNEAISYGGSTILPSTAGIVDTGTTLVLIATDAFNRYKSLTGAVDDPNTGLLRITNDQYAKLQSLFFSFGSAKLELTPNAQIWPRSLNAAIGGQSDGIYLVVSDLGANSGSGMDFITGYSFLERFYSVYDTSNKRVGLATTSNTKSTSN